MLFFSPLSSLLCHLVVEEARADESNLFVSPSRAKTKFIISRGFVSAANSARAKEKTPILSFSDFHLSGRLTGARLSDIGIPRVLAYGTHLGAAVHVERREASHDILGCLHSSEIRSGSKLKLELLFLQRRN